MIYPKFVIINPLKDKAACKSTGIDKKSLSESEPSSNEKCQWQKKRMNYFLKGFSKILMIPLKCDMTIFYCVKTSKLFGHHHYVENNSFN